MPPSAAVMERALGIRIGERFSSLVTISEPFPYPPRGTMVWCECDCGEHKLRRVSNLFSGDNKTCGCRGLSKGDLNHSWTGYGELTGTYWKNVRHHAKTRKLSCEISKEYAWRIFRSQNGLCADTGWLLRHGVGVEQTASLDRIDSRFHYVEGNVRWIHKHVNLMKRDFGLEHFRSVCGMITKYESCCLELKIGVDKSLSHGHRWRGYGELSGRQWGNIKALCRRPSRTVEISITIREAWEQFERQLGRCAMTGQELVMKGWNRPGTASLDRIDSSIGYVLGNIRWVHKDVNLMKWAISDEQFIEIARAVSFWVGSPKGSMAA